MNILPAQLLASALPLPGCTKQLSYNGISISQSMNRRVYRIFDLLRHNHDLKCSCCTTKVSYFKVADMVITPICNNGYEMTIDHIVPKALGGKNNISNFQMLCLRCNISKGSVLVAGIWHLRFHVLIKVLRKCYNRHISLLHAVVTRYGIYSW